MSNQKDKNLHADHRQRMRIKFSRSGFTGYHPHEVIEQVLFGILPRINTNPIGHRLVERFGKISDLLRTPKEKLEGVDGIGPKSAEYLASFVPKTTEMILEQYRTISDLNIFQIAFLSDWFMRTARFDQIGLIVCDNEKQFVDFKFLNVNVTPDKGTEFFTKLSDSICAEVEVGMYYLIMKEFTLERSDVYRILDLTSKRGASMIDAYKFDKRRPVSVIFTN